MGGCQGPGARLGNPAPRAPTARTTSGCGPVGATGECWRGVERSPPGWTARPPTSQPLAPLIATYTALYGASWRPLTRAKHAADFRRLLDWLARHRAAQRRPRRSIFPTLAAYVDGPAHAPEGARACGGVPRMHAAARSRMGLPAAALAQQRQRLHATHPLALPVAGRGGDPGRQPLPPLARARGPQSAPAQRGDAARSPPPWRTCRPSSAAVRGRGPWICGTRPSSRS